jgi:hypothetical protein
MGKKKDLDHIRQHCTISIFEKWTDTILYYLAIDADTLDHLSTQEVVDICDPVNKGGKVWDAGEAVSLTQAHKLVHVWKT